MNAYKKQPRKLFLQNLPNFIFFKNYEISKLLSFNLNHKGGLVIV